MNRTRHHPRGRDGGFSLIEVLVAVIVLSIGLVGLARMQTTALRFGQDAYLQTQAMNIAQDALERMRLNPDGVRAGAYDGLVIDADFSLPDSGDCDSSACDAAGLAQWDIYNLAGYFQYVPSPALCSGGASPADPATPAGPGSPAVPADPADPATPGQCVSVYGEGGEDGDGYVGALPPGARLRIDRADDRVTVVVGWESRPEAGDADTRRSVTIQAVL